MRTREEQIIECAQYLISMRASGKCTEYDLVSCIVEEAERRAEQCVRAEIGRDSERLDWLEKTRSVVLEDADNGWCVTIGGIEFSLREETARDAIDASREVG